MPHASPLSQHWQTVLSRLPESLTVQPLSAQAQSVLTFSDFVQDAIIAHPAWLAELESAPPQADEWRTMPRCYKARCRTLRMKHR